MNAQNAFLVSLGLAVLAIVLFLKFEPGITPPYQAIVLLLCFGASVLLFFRGLISWLKTRSSER